MRNYCFETKTAFKKYILLNLIHYTDSTRQAWLPQGRHDSTRHADSTRQAGSQEPTSIGMLPSHSTCISQPTIVPALENGLKSCGSLRNSTRCYTIFGKASFTPNMNWPHFWTRYTNQLTLLANGCVGGRVQEDYCLVLLNSPSHVKRKQCYYLLHK